MLNATVSHTNKIKSLEESLALLLKKEKLLLEENQFLHEQMRFLKAKLFGRSTEKLSSFDDGQLSLFSKAETEPEETKPEETKPEPETTIAGHTRKKKRNRKLPEDLPKRHVHHAVPEEQMYCACGCRKSVISEEISEQLEYKKAVLEVVCHHRDKVACKSCEGVETEGPPVTTAPAPARLIPKSYATPSLCAHVMTAKFVDSTPFYRQQAQFMRLGIDLSRSTMASWAIQVAAKAKKVVDLLLSEAKNTGYLQVDETTVQVLNEKNRANTTKSYMWVIRGGPPGKLIIVYNYRPTRASKCAAELLENFKGYIQVDGYSGYNFLDKHPDVTLLACMAHVRRKFVEVCKNKGERTGKNGLAGQALSFIKDLYKIEAGARKDGLSSAQIKALREAEAKPTLARFKTWLDETQPTVPPRSLLGKAIYYTQGQWPRLERYLEDGRLQIDNNLIENSIRPFVIGRKNWLFSGSPEGATASAALYSLVVTAKANGWDPQAYLEFLFQGLIHAKEDQDFAALLPTQAPVTETVT